MKTGLTLGKFAPLHKGHQYLIEDALSQVDKLIVLVYESPETTDIPLKVRAGWIKQLYPDVTVISGYGAPSDTGYTKEIMKLQDDYIKGVLGKRKITAFFSSEPYGEHVSRALHAKNVQVDIARDRIPISATRVRENAYACREFIDPLVYRDLITHVVFLGAPSSGKTTIAEQLAKKFSTEWMPEYGREYWDKHQQDRRLTMEQLVEIADGHLLRENQLLEKSNKYLFTDTNAITTYNFSLYYHGRALPKLEQLAKACQKRYDLVFVCDIDIPYDNTWDRSGDANRDEMHLKTLDYLNSHKIPYILLTGSLEERMKKVEATLQNFSKWRK